MTDFNQLFEQYSAPKTTQSRFAELFDSYLPKPEPAPEKQPDPGIAGIIDEALAGVPRGAGRTAGQTLKGAGQIIEDLPGVLGAISKSSLGGRVLVESIDPDIKEAISKQYERTVATKVAALKQGGQLIQDVTEKAIPIAPGMEDSLTRQISEGVGSTVPSMLSYAAGGPAAIAASGATQGYSAVYDEVKQQSLAYHKSKGEPDKEAEKNAEQEARMFARASALVTGATEPLGADVASVKVLRRLNDATGGWLAKKIINSATENALQEAIQEIPEELARLAYDKDRSLWDSAWAVTKAGALGGTVGTIVTGIASAPAMARVIESSKAKPDEAGTFEQRTDQAIEKAWKDDFPEATKLQQETAIPPGAMRAFAGPKPAEATQHAYFPRQEIAEEFERTRGLKQESIKDKIGRWAQKLGHVVSRPQEYLAQNEQNASFNEFFRLLKTIPESVRDESTRTIAAITGALEGKADFDAFSDYLIVRNQLAALDRGEPLRHPFESRSEVEQTYDNLKAVLKENPAIEQAVQRRSAVVQELVDQLADEGILPESSKQNAETYFHQQVLMYADAERQFGPSSKPVERTKSFQKKRTAGEYLGQEYAYNKDYLESEFRWMTDATAALRLRRMMNEFIRPADIKGRLVEQAKAAGEGKTWKDFIPKGYDVWQPRPGRSFFRAISVPERVYNAILDGVADEMGLDESSFRTVLALGRPNEQMVLPDDLVKQLSDQEKSAPSGGFVEGIDRMAIAVQKAWKAWSTGISPKRFLSYNIRNAFGDGDVVIAGIPGAFLETKGAVRELWDYWNGKSAITPRIKKWRDLGVLDSGFAAQEAPRLKQLPAFERFYENRGNVALRAMRGYYNTLNTATNFRESVMRLTTAERHSKMLRSGDLSNFGASNKKVIKALIKAHGTDVAAAKLARDIVGDYGNRTVMGRFLASRLLPFWSFQEINLHRYPRIAINAATAGDVSTLAKLPVMAAYRMVLMSRLAWLYAGLWMWNNLVFPGKEADNERWIRQNPHLNICRRPDGSTITFNNLGAFGELMEWFGVNTMLALRDRVESGQMTTAQLLEEAAKDPINKAVQSVRPDFKLASEVTTGTSTFPDVTSRRSVDPLTSFANVFGLVDEMNWAKGKLLEQGDRARPNYLARLLTVVTDPRQSALHEIYDLRARFLETKGRERPPSYAGDPLMRNMRQAAINNDREAFNEARRAYLKSGKNWQNFKKSLSYLDPISSRINDSLENEFINEFLTPIQRERLRVARDYAGELRDTLTAWWFEENDNASQNR